MAESVVVTADKAITPEGVRGATAVLAVAGEIVALGDPATVLADPRAAGARRIDWSRRVMVPGTVNTHNHSFQSLLRGIGDDLPFLTWRDRALYRYSPRLDANGMATAALFAFGEMLLHGVTTVCDFYYLNAQGNDHASATIEAARRLGMRIVLARCFYDWDGAPASYRETIPQAIAHFEALHARYHDTTRHLTSVQPAPHSQHGATPEMIVAGAGCARTRACRGTSTSPRRATRSTSRSPGSARGRSTRSPRCRSTCRQMIAVHGCWFDASRARAARGARRQPSPIAPAPTCSSAMASPISSTWSRRGVRVGLGTDGGCSNNRVSRVRRDAGWRRCCRRSTDRRPGDRRRDLLRARHPHRRARSCGYRWARFRPGYRCDLVALDLDDPSLWPAQALEKNVVYALSPRAITDVVVDGQEVVSARQLRNVELHEIQVRVSELTADWIRD